MPRKGRRKQTRRVGTTAQGLLFDGPDREAENKRLQPEFVDRNPHDLVLANFREHLLQTGHGWVVEFRSLLRELDWQEFEERYAGGGRRPYAPWAMVGLILYGTMKAVSSVRNLEKLSQLDVGAMWITGGIFPDYSVICRFVQRHADSLTATFFEQLTSKILCQVGAGSTLAGDGTTIEAAGSRFQIIKREAANEAARVAREAAQANPASVRLRRKRKRPSELPQLWRIGQRHGGEMGKAPTERSPARPTPRVRFRSSSGAASHRPMWRQCSPTSSGSSSPKPLTLPVKSRCLASSSSRQNGLLARSQSPSP